jgi:hypothetical protein
VELRDLFEWHEPILGASQDQHIAVNANSGIPLPDRRERERVAPLAGAALAAPRFPA